MSYQTLVYMPILSQRNHKVLHIFSYLKKYHNSEMVFDPSDPVIDEALFEKQDWASSEQGGLL